MVYVLLILGFIRGRLAKRIELADSGKKVEVMPYVRNTYDLLDFVYIMRNNCCNSYYLYKAQILQEELDSGKLSKYEISSAQMNIRAYKDIYEKDVKRKENFKKAQKILFFVEFL